MARGRSSSPACNNDIGKLDFPEPDQRTPLIQRIDSPDHSRQPSPASGPGRFFESVAEGIQSRDREAIKREAARYVSFVWAVVVTLCCGSITAFSLYGPLFQERLHYSQAKVNTVSIVAELALYLPVPIFGLLCDRYGPRPLALLAAVLFGYGYFLAAFTYRSGPPPEAGGDGWPFLAMILAFVGIGMGTSCMYLAAVTTCAKNFGRGKHKGLALAVPIACFGLSGMWQSQVGDRLLKETLPDGSKGNVDVFRYFLFLGGLLLGVGLVAVFLLKIVDEGELIDEAVEQLERSGLLEESEFYMPRAPEEGYGTMDQPERRPSTAERAAKKAQALENQRKKIWLLNAETSRFLADHTMWWLTAGFFLVTGPGEAFINNLGTIIGTLYPPPTADAAALRPTSPSTHVSIVAIASTLARLASGTLSDALAPNPSATQDRNHPNRDPNRNRSTSLTSSLTSLDPLQNSTHLPPSTRTKNFTISRLTLLLASTLLTSLGQTLLASGFANNHASDRFWLISALIGTGYGATFSLVPIVISAVWGVENFGTNWGIVAVAPAPAAAVWGAVYAAVYQQGAHGGGNGVGGGSGSGSERCFGVKCYGSTFWGMAVASWVACGLWLWAWRGPGGWKRRGVAV